MIQPAPRRVEVELTSRWEQFPDADVMISADSPSGRPTRENRLLEEISQYGVAADWEHEHWPNWELLTDRLRKALLQLRATVESSPQRMGGALVLKGTRFKVSQLIAELADSDAVEEMADEFEIDAEQIRDVLHAIAVSIDRSVC
jgi:uncharacterized protein (DUF433 family)